MKLIIKGELTDLNTYIQKERGNRYAAAAIKEEETRSVYWDCKAQKVPRFFNPVFLEFHWYCKNMRKDPDNVAFSKKAILDGLVLAKVLQDDGWKEIRGFCDRFFVDSENPRVEIIIHEETKEIQNTAMVPVKRR